MERIVVVTKPTRLEELLQIHTTLGAAKFAIESAGKDFSIYEREHTAYVSALNDVVRQLPSDVPYTRLPREEVPYFMFGEGDTVVVCGPDGLFVNTAKYLKDQPVVTVNMSPGVRSVLMLCAPQGVKKTLTAIRDQKHRIEPLPLLRARIDDVTDVWGVNDIFIGRTDQVSARYEISYRNRTEPQSSSGIIVTTKVGSTGWVSSVVNMVRGLSGVAAAAQAAKLLTPDLEEMAFVVREPFVSSSTGASVVADRLKKGEVLTVNSHMPSGGVVFSDGVIEKAVDWNAGSSVSVSIGDRFVMQVLS